MNYLLPLCHVTFDGINDAVMVTGSRVDGLGNMLSDIDYFVFTDNIQPNTIFHDRESNCWIDVTYYPMDAIPKAVASLSLNESKWSFDWQKLVSVDLKLADFIHRVHVGQWLSKRSIPLDIDRELYQMRIALTLLEPARSRLVDAIGEFRSGYEASARYVASIALSLSMDAYLALLGETNPSAKWQIRKIERSGVDPLTIFSDYLQLINKGHANDRDTAKRMIEMASSLMFSVSYYLLSKEWMFISSDTDFARLDIDKGVIVLVDQDNNIVSRFDSIHAALNVFHQK